MKQMSSFRNAQRLSSLCMLAAALLAPSWAGAFTTEEIAAASKDPQAYTLDVNSIEDVRLQDPGKPPVPRENSPAPAPLPPVNPDIITNIGKIIWEIIEANRPVVDSSRHTAVPDGVTHWTHGGLEAPGSDGL